MTAPFSFFPKKETPQFKTAQERLTAEILNRNWQEPTPLPDNKIAVYPLTPEIIPEALRVNIRKARSE